MPAHPARAALIESALAWVAACASTALFLPPLAAATDASAWRGAAAGLVVLCAWPLHWLSLARAARALEQPTGPWLGLAVFLAPLGGAAALLMLAGLRPVAARHAPV
jgi:hypothetical protein